jgi:restriction endonuclease Mrr
MNLLQKFRLLTRPLPMPHMPYMFPMTITSKSLHKSLSRPSSAPSAQVALRPAQIPVKNDTQDRTDKTQNSVDFASHSLRSRLATVPFPAFAAFVGEVLTAAGYENVQARGRTRFLGKNQSGGIDLTATLSSHLGIRTVIAQLKQLGPDVAVAQRYVDELRGVCLRTGAAEALLITTGVFANRARENAARTAHSPVAPVRLLNGESLVRLAVQHSIGVTTKTIKGSEEKTMDGAYFAALEECFAGKVVQARVRRKPALSQSPSTQPPARPPVFPSTLVRRMQGPVTVTVVVRESEGEGKGEGSQ